MAMVMVVILRCRRRDTCHVFLLFGGGHQSRLSQRPPTAKVVRLCVIVLVIFNNNAAFGFFLVSGEITTVD